MSFPNPNISVDKVLLASLKDEKVQNVKYIRDEAELIQLGYTHADLEHRGSTLFELLKTKKEVVYDVNGHPIGFETRKVKIIFYVASYPLLVGLVPTTQMGTYINLRIKYLPTTVYISQLSNLIPYANSLIKVSDIPESNFIVVEETVQSSKFDFSDIYMIDIAISQQIARKGKYIELEKGIQEAKKSSETFLMNASWISMI